MTATVAVEKKKLARSPLQLHYLGDRVLRKSAKRIAKVDDKVRELAREMLQTMYSEDGIGLAAPQVAVDKQMLVIDCDPENAASQPLILINPEIVGFGRDRITSKEGCLSIPEVYLEVTRPEVVEVKFKDETGRPRRLKASGLLSRAIQHEMDHLNGVLFVDRVGNDLALVEELQKHGFAVQAVQSLTEEKEPRQC